MRVAEKDDISAIFLKIIFANPIQNVILNVYILLGKSVTKAWKAGKMYG